MVPPTTNWAKVIPPVCLSMRQGFGYTCGFRAPGTTVVVGFDGIRSSWVFAVVVIFDQRCHRQAEHEGFAEEIRLRDKPLIQDAEEGIGVSIGISQRITQQLSFNFGLKRI